MGTGSHLMVTIALLVAASTAAAAQSLEPEWSRPVGGQVRLVGVEENGRCSVLVDKGTIQVVSPSGNVAWSWPFRKISKFINPGAVAVSHDCGAIAFVGDASYKYAWVVQRSGRSASIAFQATPADVEFDRDGKLVTVGTYAGSLHLYSISGELQWTRDTSAAIVNDLEFTDDNQRIVFKGWGGAGVVSVAGQVEWSSLANKLAAAKDLSTFIFSNEPNHGPGLPSITVTDHQRKGLWHRWAAIAAFISATGDRVLARVDKVQEKAEADFFDGPHAGSDVQLLSRDGTVIATFADYLAPLALADNGSRAWLRAADHVACVDDKGNVLARIEGEVRSDSVNVSRDFAQVLIIREQDLHAVSIERYEVPKPCRP